MKFNVTLDRDEDGVWIVECPSIPGCVSQGQTKEESVENIKDAIAACLQVRAELGLPLTTDTVVKMGQKTRFLSVVKLDISYAQL